MTGFKTMIRQGLDGITSASNDRQVFRQEWESYNNYDIQALESTTSTGVNATTKLVPGFWYVNKGPIVEVPTDSSSLLLLNRFKQMGTELQLLWTDFLQL